MAVEADVIDTEGGPAQKKNHKRKGQRANQIKKMRNENIQLR